jgi:hypothetical protein
MTRYRDRHARQNQQDCGGHNYFDQREATHANKSYLCIHAEHVTWRPKNEAKLPDTHAFCPSAPSEARHTTARNT